RGRQRPVPPRPAVGHAPRRARVGRRGARRGAPARSARPARRHRPASRPDRAGAARAIRRPPLGASGAPPRCRVTPFARGDDPRKDVVTAVAAHRALVGDVPHDLVLVGRAHPTFSPVAVPSVATVRRLGYVDDDELPALLTGASALLFPSHYEGFGLPPLEAMACGTPAVVSDLPVLRETTWDLARYVSAGDVSAWVVALRGVLEGQTRVPELPEWSGRDV